MPDARRQFGDRAEDAAARMLAAKGMRIRAKQFRSRTGEIDLIVEDGDEIVFVEVKARTTNRFGYPEEAVTKTKLQKIARTAEWYLAAHRLLDRPWRIDVVGIEFSENPPRITHIPAVG